MKSFSTIARKLRSSETSAEARLWRALRGRRLSGWKFRRQHPIDRYVVDFVTLSGRLVVEVDGATHGTLDEEAQDRRRTELLVRLGFQVMRFSNADIYDNIEGVLLAILKELRIASPLPEGEVDGEAGG